MRIRKENVAVAGGQLLAAAFGFLQQMIPEQAQNEQTQQLAQQFKQRFGECLESSEDGALKLTVTLPDTKALDNLANSMARLLG